MSFGLCDGGATEATWAPVALVLRGGGGGSSAGLPGRGGAAAAPESVDRSSGAPVTSPPDTAACGAIGAAGSGGAATAGGKGLRGGTFIGAALANGATRCAAPAPPCC